MNEDDEKEKDDEVHENEYENEDDEDLFELHVDRHRERANYTSERPITCRLISVGKGNKACFIRVWIPLPCRCVQGGENLEVGR